MVNPAARGNLVLVVDDSPDTLGMLNTALEFAGMTTLVALEGLQAINIATKMQPDIILLDAIMPHLDGFETCRRIKADIALKNIPVIFMTGLSDIDSIVNGFAVGGVDYLTKPINPQELIARIHVHLANARTTASAQMALDSSGHSVCALSSAGQKLWATPSVEKLWQQLTEAGVFASFQQQLQLWLERAPVEGNRCYFCHQAFQLTMMYMGLASSGEHLVKIFTESAGDESAALRQMFAITQRESEVLLWLTKGKTNREIAQILDMSPRTVNKHLEQLFKKLDVDNRTTAAAKAIVGMQKG